MAKSMPPAFQDYSSYSEIHRKFAVTDHDELVRIVDWQDTDYDGRRKLVVEDADPDSPGFRSLAWVINETRLTPIGDHGSRMTRAQAMAAAQAWRARRLAMALDEHTPPAGAARHAPRL